MYIQHYIDYTSIGQSKSAKCHFSLICHEVCLNLGIKYETLSGQNIIEDIYDRQK